MDFSDAIKTELTHTYTENGARALNTTSDRRLDFFSSVGALRGADIDRKIELYEGAYMIDPLFTTKILFYARDIRGGLGERETFRELLKYSATKHPETIRPNISLIPFYGRWDDLYSLIGTPLENDMWECIREQFVEDVKNEDLGLPVSLLGKWLKSADASSIESKRLGILTAKKLGLSVYLYKRKVRALRKRIDITERKMSNNIWDEIDYPAVPSRAMNIYRNAFMTHDEKRFSEYLEDVSSGKAKINSGALYPYDIITKYINRKISISDEVAELQWKNLPNYITKPSNSIVMADISASMSGRPIATSIGLAIYFAERNTGPYHNLFMTFSSTPEFVEIKSDSLKNKIREVMTSGWGNNTNLEAALIMILNKGIEYGVSPDEMPENLIIISDMEIDQCTDKSWNFYDGIERMFWKHGYKIPNVVFWNVCSRHNTFLADSKRKGVQLISGSAISSFKHLIENINSTPIQLMEKVIGSDRYSGIR